MASDFLKDAGQHGQTSVHRLGTELAIPVFDRLSIRAPDKWTLAGTYSVDVTELLLTPRDICWSSGRDSCSLTTH
jgi:hypothetical protein